MNTEANNQILWECISMNENIRTTDKINQIVSQFTTFDFIQRFLLEYFIFHKSKINYC